jgi:hypothetical protein
MMMDAEETRTEEKILMTSMYKSMEIDAHECG